MCDKKQQTIIIINKFDFEIGFKNGYVHWDDEDTRNSNKHGGILPSGIFGGDTRINYCCRFVTKRFFWYIFWIYIKEKNR